MDVGAVLLKLYEQDPDVYFEDRAANAEQDEFPDWLWAYARTFGERFNNRLRSGVAAQTGRAYSERREAFGWDGVYGCGLCQTGVPCESRNPVE